MPAPRRALSQTPDQHPYGQHLAAAQRAGGAPYTLWCGTPDGARALARALARCRLRKHWGLPGTFDPTSVDPKGVGLGLFDTVRIAVRGETVVLQDVSRQQQQTKGTGDVSGLEGRGTTGKSPAPSGFLRRLLRAAR